nr:hypothetical protein [Flavihumibacter sp. UBA7668]
MPDTLHRWSLPDTINQLALYQLAAVYGLLFSNAWSTIQSFVSDPKHLSAQTGMISILHTWWQTPTLHQLYPVKAMSSVFRAR